jgi:hypothetical protein
VTINALHEIHEVSKLSVNDIVKVWVEYHKLCVRWVPIMLIENHKQTHMDAVLMFLMCHSEESVKFLDSTVF